MSLENYRGVDGYNRMLGELQSSMEMSFPELVGRVYAFNQYNDISDEIIHAAEYLGLEPEEMTRQIEAQNDNTSLEEQRPAGIAYQLQRADGTTVTICFDGSGGTAVELTPDIIEIFFKNALHEVGHGIANHLYPEIAFPTGQEYQSMRQELDPMGNVSYLERFRQLSPEGLNTFLEVEHTGRFQETLAELFALSVMTNNGFPKSKYWDNAIAGYDRSQLILAFDRYDIGEESRYLLEHYPEFLENPTPPSSYRLKNMREAIEYAWQATNHHNQPTNEDIYESYMLSNALLVALNIEYPERNPTEDEFFLTAQKFSHLSSDARSSEAGYVYSHATSQSDDSQLAYSSPIGEKDSLERAAAIAYLDYINSGDVVMGNVALDLLRSVFAMDDLGFRPEFNLSDEDALALFSTDIPPLAWAENMRDGTSIEEVAELIHTPTTSPVLEKTAIEPTR